MPIKEESFRIGSGRYLQGAGYARRIGEEVDRLGSSAYVIGGPTALSLAGEALDAGLSGNKRKYKIVTHRGTCSDEAAGRLAEEAVSLGYDVIVGVGGGVICDLAKLCADTAGLPVISLPTSSATCAAYTPLSVRYTEDGRTVGSRHFDHEVNCVIADTALISTEPARLLLSGVFDSLAKLVEIKQRYVEGADCPLGLDYAYAMSVHSYRLLTERVERCIEDMASGRVSPEVESVVFTAIAATGVISGIARGSNQTALAHKLYELTRTLYPEKARPYLHGEIVGVGLLLQNHFNGECEANAELLSLMRGYGMPHSIGSMGIPTTEATLEEYYSRLVETSAMEGASAAECRRLHAGLEYLWGLD